MEDRPAEQAEGRTTEQCWEDLANAVILQALEDYRDACRALRGRPDLRVQAARKRSLERFFRSRWFRVLSDLDGKKLLKQIQKEVDHDHQRGMAFPAE